MYILYCTCNINYCNLDLLGGVTDSLANLARAPPSPPTTEDSLPVLARDRLEDDEEGGAREFPRLVVVA